MEGKNPGGPSDSNWQVAGGPPQYTPSDQREQQSVGYALNHQPGFVAPQPHNVEPKLYPEPNIYPEPPPPSYVPMPAPTVIIGSPMAVGPTPMNTICPSCNAQIVTSLRYETSTKTHILAALLCVIGCWPCACIPYCVDSCQNANHYCPACQVYLGTYKS